MSTRTRALCLHLGLCPLPLPPGADQASPGGLEGLPRVSRLLGSPAEAVKGSQHGLSHEDSTRYRDAKTEAAWASVQDPMERQQCVQPAAQGDTDRKGPESSLRGRKIELGTGPHD